MASIKFNMRKRSGPLCSPTTSEVRQRNDLACHLACLTSDHVALRHHSSLSEQLATMDSDDAIQFSLYKFSASAPLAPEGEVTHLFYAAPVALDVVVGMTLTITRRFYTE